MADQTVSPGVASTTASDTPPWYDELAGQFGNNVSGALGMVSQLGNNWYNQPYVAGLTPEQQNIIGSAGQTAGQWTPYFNTGWQNMSDAGGLTQLSAQMAQGAGTYDPNEMMKHLNPYLPGVLDEIARRGNQNLTENVMPNVNRTFTGSGIFGSSQNADFLQRAMAKNQQEILGTQAGAVNTAYDNAAKDYFNWGQLGETAASNVGRAGTDLATTGMNMGKYGMAGQEQSWTDLGNRYDLQEKGRTNVQQSLDAAYKDWQARLTTPISMMQNLSQILPNATSLYGGKSTVTGANPTSTSGLTDLMSVLTALGSINNGGTVQY